MKDARSEDRDFHSSGALVRALDTGGARWAVTWTSRAEVAAVLQGLSVAVFVFLVCAFSCCAFLRLNGCSQVKKCGELAVYSCGDDLVCADAEGNAVRSELTSPQRNYCHVCQAE